MCATPPARLMREAAGGAETLAPIRDRSAALDDACPPTLIPDHPLPGCMGSIRSCGRRPIGRGSEG